MIQIALNDDRRPPVSRPLTPVRPPHSRLSALSALLAAITCGCLFCIQEARADIVDWSSFVEVVGEIPEGWFINYTSSDSANLPNMLSGILYADLGGGGGIPIGGFDLLNGVVSLSYFGDIGERYSANTEGLNSSYKWEVYYDFDGDGVLGTRIEGTSTLMDRSERLSSSQYTISNFTPFGDYNPGNFTFTTTVGQIASTTVTAAQGGSNVVTLTIGQLKAYGWGEPKIVRVEYKDSLGAAEWTELGTYGVTDPVTVVADTNAAPARFYRAVAP